MQELLDAIDAAMVEARSDSGCETLVHNAESPDILIRSDLWERICIERSKIEPEEHEIVGTCYCKLPGAECPMHSVAALLNAPPANVLEDVRDFLAIGHPHMLAPEPGTPEFSVDELCWRLIQEELNELTLARIQGDLVEIADGVQDLIWVVACFGYAYGLPMNALWTEVARTNMAKFPGGVVTRRPSDGKIMKPPGWQDPRISEILAAAFLATPPPAPVAPEPVSPRRISNPFPEGIYPPWADKEQEVTDPVWFDYEHQQYGHTRIAVYATRSTEGRSPVAELAVRSTETPAEVFERWWAAQREKITPPPAPVAPDPHCVECGIPILEKSHGDRCDPCETKKLTESLG